MEWISGNNFLRYNFLAKAGDKLQGHKHNFDHTTFVLTGAVNVLAKRPDGRVQDGYFEAVRYDPDNPTVGQFLVRAGVEHEITALEDNTVFVCIYSHRDPQGEVVQEYTGLWRAYL